MERFYKELGRMLREKREQQDGGLTQQVLAERVGLRRTSITNIELGKQHISVDMLYKFAAALNVQPHDLLPHQKFAIDNASEMSDRIGRLQLTEKTKEILYKISAQHSE